MKTLGTLLFFFTAVSSLPRMIGSANFFCKWPDSKYFLLCGPGNFCRNYLALPESSHTLHVWMSVTMFQIDLTYKNRQWTRSGPRACSLLTPDLKQGLAHRRYAIKCQKVIAQKNDQGGCDISPVELHRKLFSWGCGTWNQLGSYLFGFHGGLLLIFDVFTPGR